MTATVSAHPGLVARTVRNQRRRQEERAPLRRWQPGQQQGDGFCRPMSKAERDHLWKVARLYSKAHRVKGVAPITHATLEVMRTMLYELMDWTTGELTPAYVWIATKSRHGYATAVAAVTQLESLGILHKQRRQTRNDDPDGPMWVQDTNAYRFELPAKLRTWWSAYKADKAERARLRTVPEDQETRIRTAEAANAAEDEAWGVQASEADKAARREAARARPVFGPGAAAYRAKLE